MFTFILKYLLHKIWYTLEQVRKFLDFQDGA